MSYWNAGSALREEHQRRIKRRRNLCTIIQVILVITSVIFVVYPVADWAFRIRPTYYEHIGQHVDRALLDYEHPQIVKVYITRAMDGIAELGLEPTDNSALYNNYSKRKVAYQYVIFDSIIQRCDEIIQWRDMVLSNFDLDLYTVYMGKLEELNTYMYAIDDVAGGSISRECDWVAFGAYLNKTEYPFLYRMPAFQVLWVIGSGYAIYLLKQKKLEAPIIVSEQIRRESNVRL